MYVYWLIITAYQNASILYTLYLYVYLCETMKQYCSLTRLPEKCSDIEIYENIF